MNEEMITTVTTTTTTVVSTSTSTVVSTSTAGVVASLGILGVIILILLLIAKELLSSHGDKKISFLANNLNIAIVPLLVMFGTIVFTKITSLL